MFRWIFESAKRYFYAIRQQQKNILMASISIVKKSNNLSYHYKLNMKEKWYWSTIQSKHYFVKKSVRPTYSHTFWAEFCQHITFRKQIKFLRIIHAPWMNKTVDLSMGYSQGFEHHRLLTSGNRSCSIYRKDSDDGATRQRDQGSYKTPPDQRGSRWLQTVGSRMLGVVDRGTTRELCRPLRPLRPLGHGHRDPATSSITSCRRQSMPLNDCVRTAWLQPTKARIRALRFDDLTPSWCSTSARVSDPRSCRHRIGFLSAAVIHPQLNKTSPESVQTLAKLKATSPFAKGAPISRRCARNRRRGQISCIIASATVFCWNFEPWISTADFKFSRFKFTSRDGRALREGYDSRDSSRETAQNHWVGVRAAHGAEARREGYRPGAPGGAWLQARVEARSIVSSLLFLMHRIESVSDNWSSRN